MRVTLFVLAIFAFCVIEISFVRAAVVKMDVDDGKKAEEKISWKLLRRGMGFDEISSAKSDQSTVRVDDIYENTALVVELPDQPDRMVQMLLSMIVSDNNFTQDINEAIINCLAVNSSTDSNNWGLYNSEKFTNTLLQAEYFAEVSEEASLSFPLIVDEYVRNGELRKCVLDKDVGLTETGSLLSGRTTIAHRSGAIVSSAGSIPGWLVGAVVGALTLVALVGLVVFSARECSVYPESDYEGSTGRDASSEIDLERGFNEEDAQWRLVKELKTIAGQRNEPLFVKG